MQETECGAYCFLYYINLERTQCPLLSVSPQEEYRNSMPASSFQQQKLRVCEVCSAYLGLHDNDRRLADHFGGKLHLGFIQIREKLDLLKVNSCLYICDCHWADH